MSPDPIPAAPAPAPVAEAPAPPPVAAAPIAEAPAPVEAAPAPEPATPEPAPAPEPAAASLLSGDAPAEPIPADPLPPISYESLKAPEGVELGDAVKPFMDVFAEARIAPEIAQKLVDVYAAHRQAETQAMRSAFTDLCAQWQAQVKADPEIGGNRQETSIQRAKQAIAKFGGTPEQVADLKAALDGTGAGNHPGLVRLLNNVAKALVSEGRGVPAVQAKAPAAASRPMSRYANSMQVNGA